MYGIKLLFASLSKNTPQQLPFIFPYIIKILFC
jgi:hypothetical protein